MDTEASQTGRIIIRRIVYDAVMRARHQVVIDRTRAGLTGLINALHAFVTAVGQFFHGYAQAPPGT